MYSSECGDVEFIRNSVPIDGRSGVYEEVQPDAGNCSNGVAPQPNTTAGGCQKLIVPAVVSMTRYLFAHYRLQMYAYLNNSLRNGIGLFPQERTEKEKACCGTTTF